MQKMMYRRIDKNQLDFLFYAGVFGLFFLQVLFMFSSAHADRIAIAYFPILVAVFFTYVLVRLGLPKTTEGWLMLALTLWHPVTCILNGDRYLQASSPLVYYVMLSCGVLFPTAYMLEAKSREKLIKGIALVYSLPMAVLAWIAVVCTITGNPWLNPIDKINILGVNWVYANPYRLNFLGIHPNISGAYLYIALSLLLYLFFATKRTWLSVLYIIAGIGIYVSIMLTASNASIGLTALILAITAYAVFTSFQPAVNRKVLKGLLIAFVVMVVVIASYPLLLQVISIGDGSVAQAETQSATDNETAVVIKPRFNTAVQTMEGRFLIYKSAFLSIQDRPLTLLIGELWDDAMARSARMINFPLQNHVHNSFLQTLVVGGGIACLLVVIFTVLLVIRSVRLFLGDRVPLHTKLLVLVPVALLGHSMVEAILFIDSRPPNMFFFLLAGMIFVYTSELCPAQTKKAKKKHTA